LAEFAAKAKHAVRRGQWQVVAESLAPRAVDGTTGRHNTFAGRKAHGQARWFCRLKRPPMFLPAVTAVDEDVSKSAISTQAQDAAT
jgi:hypothetical protein